MDMSDRILTCCECNAQFCFSVEEQQFFSLKRLENLPKRCPGCRLLNRARRNGVDTSNFAVVECSICGERTRVPFQPKGHKPVLCTGCFQHSKVDKQETALVSSAASATTQNQLHDES